MGYRLEETANPKDMEAYYDKEKIEKYGVVGIGNRVNLKKRRKENVCQK